MPWWSWVLIWFVLVLILLGVLVLSGVYLWRKLKSLLGELDTAQARLSPALADGVPVSAGPTSQLPVGWEALEAEPIEVRAGLREEKQARKDARRTRRIQMLLRTGRPRRYSDLDHIAAIEPQD